MDEQHNFQPGMDIFLLTEIACYSAGEINDQAKGRKPNYKATKELISRLTDYVSSDCKNPETSQILWETFKKKEHSDREIRWLEDLDFKTSLLIKDLQDIKRHSKAKLDDLMHFCIDLSYQTSAYEPLYAQYAGVA